MTFLAPSALWLLTLLPVVVALHYLRARRRRYSVPALFLWQRAHTAVARKRRFSPTWLLVAQLLFVTLAALALARPVLDGGQKSDLVLIVDASASMAAVDEGGTRLEQAVALARGLLGQGRRVALIRAGLEAKLLAAVDADAAQLRQALDALSAGDADADLLRALELADSLLPGAQVHVFTDHDVSLGAASLHRVGGPVNNVGISAFDIGIGQAFVAVVASGSRPAEVQVELTQGGRLLARGTVLVPTSGSGSITFPVEEAAGAIQARLTPPPGDALQLDDVAYAGSRAAQVVSDDSYEPLVRALASVPLTRVSVTPDAAFRASADLKVVQRADPQGLPPGNYLLFPPPAAEPVYQVIREWDRADPLLRFVDLRDVVVGLDPGRPAWEESGEWRVLASTADLTPVIRSRQGPDGLLVQLAFHPSQSDIVLRPAFPALMANLLAGLGGTARVRLGQPLPGATQPVLQPGVYTVQVDGAPAEVYASLLSEGESSLPRGAPGALVLTPAPGPAAGPEPLAAAADASAPPSTLAVALLVLALLALALEWLLFRGSRGRRLVG